MDYLQAIIFGIVEGLTEYIPVSSTGHLILAKSFMGLTQKAIDPYLIVIQSGAILAVLGLYRKRVLDMIKGLLGKNPIGLKLAINLIIAFLPAAVFGVLLNDLIDAWLMGPIPVIWALAIGGVLMLFAARWQRNAFHEGQDAKSFIDIEHLTWKRALIIGLVQCLAMFPGTSRSMVTIVASMAMGMKPKHAAEFSFLLGLPTLGGATVYKLIKDADALSTLEIGPMILGIIVAFFAAAIAIKWLVAYLSKHGLALFGWYRIALAILVAIYFWDGNNASNTPLGGEDTSSTVAPVTFENDHCPAFPVAIHKTPLTITGPTADCHLPVFTS
ncbi:MAG: undecaprenyl-diphosphate phosphatase [Phycisphaerae bacterium]|nr:undecaprenyl-diphosphate phosphatase [Phycisphaerae bacterium]|tara:strand:+ start:7477 stop:8463 length:987 start_codon:yes stop_codon:yes gene_type:complete